MNAVDVRMMYNNDVGDREWAVGMDRGALGNNPCFGVANTDVLCVSIYIHIYIYT